MISNLKFSKIILLLIAFYSSLVFGIKFDKQNNPQILTISSQIALPIGIKIWFNECGGSVDGLTAWNDGEDFASLGIGHFVWHPAVNPKRASFASGFPYLIRYIEKRGGYKVPRWLHNALYCPWSNRQEFLRAKNSSRMAELRMFLQRTVPVQAECMVKHLEEILPGLLESTPSEDRSFIYNKFYLLARTPSGIYALVDYLNFKGAGISNSRSNYLHGSGLLQVLRGMKFAPPRLTPLQAYVWSAKKALLRRIETMPPSANTERWLGGWFNRVNTYLEGDYLTATQHLESAASG
jgi:hypothetical protein